MSSISKFFTTKFSTYRQEWTGDSSANVLQETFYGWLEQGVADIYQEYSKLEFSKAYTIICPVGTDVSEGDRLTQGTDAYHVRFVIDRNKGSNPHLVVLAEKVI
jgi:hypothetical protein